MELVNQIDKRLTVVEAILPTLATKTDLAELRADMNRAIGDVRAEMKTGFGELRVEMGQLHTDFERGQRENMRWIVGVLIAVFIGMFATIATFAQIAITRTSYIPAPLTAPASTIAPSAAAPLAVAR